MNFDITDEILQKIGRFTLEEMINLVALDKHEFKQLLVIARIRKLIQELKDEQKIFTTPWYVRTDNISIDFGPIDWENPIGSENEETNKLFGNYIDLKFDYTRDKSSKEYRIKIILRIRCLKDIPDNLPDNPLIRERIFELAKQHPIFRPKNNLAESRMIIYENRELQELNYKDGNIENIIKKAEDIWRKFIENDFVIIENIITRNKEYIIHGNSLTSS